MIWYTTELYVEFEIDLFTVGHASRISTHSGRLEMISITLVGRKNNIIISYLTYLMSCILFCDVWSGSC